jgi:hypothetical protein
MSYLNFGTVLLVLLASLSQAYINIERKEINLNVN